MKENKMKLKNKKTVVRAIALTVAMLLLACMCVLFTGCEVSGTAQDTINTRIAADKLQASQATPTDIEYSLERYNLIRRAYWVNGQREKANSLPCQIEKPLGYVILMTESGSVVGKFTVDGKVSSLNSFLTPDTHSSPSGSWLADVDGSYGENDNGIFFFTPDGKYVEWSGTYLYSDIPFEVDAPVVNYTEVG
jgi:hypothetical protein